jgi:hypothetical protein
MAFTAKPRTFSAAITETPLGAGPKAVTWADRTSSAVLF